jgi:hypothetical protein
MKKGITFGEAHAAGVENFYQPARNPIGNFDH